MQFLIRGLNNSDNGQYNELSRYILAIEDNCLVIKSNNNLNASKNHAEIYRKSFAGWGNIRFNGDKYVIDRRMYINIKSDILIQDDGKYELKHFQISFIPLQTYNLNKFFEYLNELNKGNLNEEQLRILGQLRIQELEVKQREEEKLRIIEVRKLEAKQQEEEKLRIIEARKLEAKQQEEEKLRIIEARKLEAKQREEERLKIIEAEALRVEKLEIQNFTNTVNRIRQNRELEKIFINYFSKYAKQELLHPQNFTSLMNDLLKNNSMYEKVKIGVPTLCAITLDESIKGCNYRLDHIDKMIEFINREIANSNKEYAKLLTWVEISDVAISYYSNCFYEQYGKQVGNIDNLNLNDSIFKYIQSDIFYEEEEKQGMFVYFLMSINKFEEVDANKGYIYCRKIFKDIYDKLKKENEYDNFIGSLLINKQTDKKVYNINDIDLMAGNEFEIFVGELFKKMGYKTIITKASGDQGVDVIVEKSGVRYGIQAKCYSNVVSNSAIQEVVAGLSFYKCDKAIVITNNHFTSSAIQLAQANQVVLWDREMLKQKIEDLFL